MDLLQGDIRNCPPATRNETIRAGTVTKAQVKKLETILGKLENLERQVADDRIRERLHAGKNELLDALSMSEN